MDIVRTRGMFLEIKMHARVMTLYDKNAPRIFNFICELSNVCNELLNC